MLDFIGYKFESDEVQLKVVNKESKSDDKRNQEKWLKDICPRDNLDEGQYMLEITFNMYYFIQQ